MARRQGLYNTAPPRHCISATGRFMRDDSIIYQPSAAANGAGHFAFITLAFSRLRFSIKHAINASNLPLLEGFT